MEVSSICPEIQAGCPTPAVQPALEELATIVRYENGQSIYRSADSADFLYRILTGAARKCAVTSGGSRRILDFLFPYDLFGIGSCARHRFAVEVLIDGTTIARYPRCLVERLADSDPLVAREIREAAFEAIHRLEARMIMLGLGRANERVSAFLLELADRLGDHGCQGEICLPMSRYDVADYLAMAVETVSRVLTQLRLQGVIRLSGLRSVRVCDWEALERICGAVPTAPPETAGGRPALRCRRSDDSSRGPDGRQAGRIKTQSAFVSRRTISPAISS